jgi:predicted nucleic acid-binding protein
MLTTKNIVIALVGLLLLTTAVIIYRMFFQFSQSEIKIYALDEAEKYEDKKAAYNIIMDGVQYILSSHNLTQQVLKSAKASKTDKEQELVHAAIMQAKQFTYLPK